MKLIFCLDDRKGLAFNKRRQSRDSAVIKDIIDECGGEIIWISPYSETIFSQQSGENRSFKVTEGEPDTGCSIYFAELEISTQLMDKADSLSVYYWNRAYPGDSFVNIDNSLWKIINEKEFKGNSHEKITRRDYIRR